MKIVVPMAGKGSRFLEKSDSNPEYKKPKPLINVFGKPMVAWAVESLPFVHLNHRPVNTKFIVNHEDLIFICRQDHEDEHNIYQSLKSIFGDDIKLVFLDHITRGAAETVFMAKDFIAENEPLIVSDSDHFFDATPLYEEILINSDAKGIIPVFMPPDNEPKWSYTLFDNLGKALAVGEKDATLAAQGAWANIGAYYFQSGKLFIDEVEDMIEKNEMYGAEDKKEFYVAPIFDRLIKKGHIVKAAKIPQVWGLGTPNDLEYFLKNYKS